MIFGYNILLPIHILFIDLVTDSIPSLALSFEKSEKGIMNQPPRGIDKPLFTPFILICIVSSALIETIMGLIIFFTTKNFMPVEQASTLALLSIVIQEIIYAIVCRNLKHPVISQGLFSNSAMNIGLLIVLLVEAAFFFTPVGKIISIASINPTTILVVIGINCISFIIYEILKPVLRNVFDD